MFPNLRLMIVAVVASILGISCALGLFAEFRVSHDSFLRESNANAPLQLGVGDGALGRIVNTAAPFEFRFQAPPPAGGFATTGGSETSDQATIAAAPQPARPAETVAAPAPRASTPTTLDLGSATEPAAMSGSPDRAAETSSPAAAGSIANQSTEQDTPQNNQENAKPEAEGDVAAPMPASSPVVGTTATPSPPAAGAIAGQDHPQRTPKDSRQSTEPGGDVAARTPPTSPAVGTTVLKAEIPPATARTAAPAKRPRTTLRRPTARRAQRTWSVAPLQGFTGVQPAFQWTQPASQSPQAPRRRIIRRVRPVRKPAAQTAIPQTAVSNAQPLDTPE
jgi:hypothetical protein